MGDGVKSKIFCVEIRARRYGRGLFPMRTLSTLGCVSFFILFPFRSLFLFHHFSLLSDSPPRVSPNMVMFPHLSAIICRRFFFFFFFDLSPPSGSFDFYIPFLASFYPGMGRVAHFLPESPKLRQSPEDSRPGSRQAFDRPRCAGGAAASS